MFRRNHQSTHPHQIPLPLRHLGLIIAVKTTPPSILITPLDGSRSIPSLTLSRNQLKDILDYLASGEAQVSYTIQAFPQGRYAPEVQLTRGVFTVLEGVGGVPAGDHGRTAVPILRSQRGLPEGNSTRRCQEWVHGAQERQR